jgi:hypothetical protein
LLIETSARPSATGGRGDHADGDDMSKPSNVREISGWVDKALAHANMNQSDLSRALVQAGLTSVDRSAVSLVIKGKRALRAEEMLEISRITGYPIPRQGGSPAVPAHRSPAAETKGPGRSVDRRLAQARELLDTLRQIEALAAGARRKR